MKLTNMKNWLFALLLMLMGFTLGSWGFLVHRTTTQLAIYQLPKSLRNFYFSNAAELVKLSTAPDERRNKDSNEATKHFIDLEAFHTPIDEMPIFWDAAVAKFSKDTLLKYGWVPYQIIIVKNQLTEAFRRGEVKEIIRLSADLGHYIQDAHVPLHTTLNYDGQLTNQNGIHSLWESVVPELEINGYQLYDKTTATYLVSPEKTIWEAIKLAHNLLPQVLSVEKELSSQFTDSTKYRYQKRNNRTQRYYTSNFAKAYGKALAPTIEKQLKLSAKTTACFWYTAWVDAGKPNLTKLTKEQKHQLKRELKHYKKEKLITDSLLISLKKRTNNPIE